MILITKDNKDKLRYVDIIHEPYNDNGYIIKRVSGIIGGKPVQQAPLIITEGKAGRSIEEQVKLEFNSLINKSLNKGYKLLSELTNETDLNKLDLSLLNEAYGQKTDQSGIRKPMLAKETSNAKPALWKRYWQISKKLDGTRCMLYWNNEKQEVCSASRGGKNYDAAITHIRNNPKLIKLLSKRPNVMLDGEIYVHGMSLQEISGISRLDTYDEERCGILEYHCYDLAVPGIDFQHRLEMLDNMRDYFMDEKKIKVLKHYEVYGYDEAKAYHDNWVAQGYEGAVLRDPTKEYGFGARDSRMVKLKEFKDAEFEITGYVLGLRGAEDMVFKLKTKDGVEFEAKPMGDRQLKNRYLKDIDKIIGQKGTVKYFYITEDGKPFLPVFKCVRNYE